MDYTDCRHYMNDRFYEDRFPDGSVVDEWFHDVHVPKLGELGRQYILTDYGINADGNIHTEQLQKLIDTAADNGGGVIVVPEGTYLTGALFFRQGVNLYVKAGGMLKGSDDISDYPVIKTRIEGESCMYYAALINADGIDGFTMCGEGTIDGSGLRSWKSFWLRRSWNPACTNKDEQRARLVYISGCTNVTVAGLRLQNSQFWTNHIYKCSHVRYINCSIFSPRMPVKAPSTDAIDIDACSCVLIKGCRMEVNDDAVALKGGKGPWADEAPENGANQNIIIEDCTFGFCHGCLTCGSESVHNRNIIMRRINVQDGYNLLWLKMRPDTPQRYEYILIEDVSGRTDNFININPWTQFFNLQGRSDVPLSYAGHIMMRQCQCECINAYNVQEAHEQYILEDIRLEDNCIKQSENHNLSEDNLSNNLHTQAE